MKLFNRENAFSNFWILVFILVWIYWAYSYSERIVTDDNIPLWMLIIAIPVAGIGAFFVTLLMFAVTMIIVGTLYSTYSDMKSKRTLQGKVGAVIFGLFFLLYFFFSQ